MLVKVLAIIGAPLLAVLGLMFALVVVVAPGSPTYGASCVTTPVAAVDDVHLDAEQLLVSQTIIAVGKELQVPARGWVVALAAGLQESGLRPLPYGDRDSLGVFQQRTAWGPVEVRMDPAGSARMFFTGGRAGQPGLLDITGWESMPVTVAAQRVQVSAYPDAYAKWEPLAVQLVAEFADVDATCVDPTAESQGWVSPVGQAAYVLTAGFGECGDRWANCHTGQDFAVPTGTPIVAASNGTVTFAGSDGPYGNAIHVLHAGGVATWYAHLSRIEVSSGTPVKPGQVIGLSGATGNVTGPHLHFEVRTGASRAESGTSVDPLAWLRARHVL